MSPLCVEWGERYENDTAIAFVFSMNIQRRHLNESQRAMIAARLATNRKGRPKKNSGIPLFSQEEAADLLNVSLDSVKCARKVQECASVEIIEAVDQGEMSLHEALSILNGEPHRTRNTGDNEWYTPEDYIERARFVLNEIDLDPATSPEANRTVKASQIFTKEDDGLKHEWRGRVWLNPPYSQPIIQHFVEKLVTGFKQGEVSEAILLVNNSTETGWFQSAATIATAICFPSHRIKFVKPEGDAGSPLQGQAFLYFGERREDFQEAFADYGAIVCRYNSSNS
jgi:ParB family chromosome partitioning protein